MTANSKTDYSILDRPEILMFLFHPRPESNRLAGISAAQDMLITVEPGVDVGARFHMAAKTGVNILFFHGNGEIVSDYDELGPVFNQMDINFLAIDYRGYGRSTGQPTVSAMMKDCHVIFSFIKEWLTTNNYAGPLVVMGRSLGSASALELVQHYKNEIDGLIIESGFAHVTPLLKLLGIDTETLGFKEETGFGNIDKIRDFDKPTLIIHAELDHIIAYSEGESLYNACAAPNKALLKISGANHNDIFMRGFTEYMAGVKALATKLMPEGS
jgi:fermentation-respiration switch protein FrsA (DUF1100 family)